MNASNRRSYTAKQKLDVIEYAELNGNRAAARFYNINESNIRAWKKMGNVLKAIPKTKRAMRAGPVKYPEIERKLNIYVMNMREKGIRISTVELLRQAKIIAEKDGISDFHGQVSWGFNFMRRNNLAIRTATSIGQKLPIDWMAKVEGFRNYVDRHSLNVEDEHVGNMDEISISFDLPATRTVNLKGAKDISISTTGHEKNNFTVVLAVTKDGSKLPPLVIFKRKTVPKENFPKGIFVQANEKGWINKDMMHFWLNNVWKKRKHSFFNTKSLLIMDSCRAHITEDVKEKVSKYSNLAIIPGGLTKKLQPLDLTVNKSFKAKIRKEWNQWMINENFNFTKSGRIKKATYLEITNWILDSWVSVTKECVINGFKKLMDENGNMENETVNIDEECINVDVHPEILEAIESLHLNSGDEFDGF